MEVEFFIKNDILYVEDDKQFEAYDISTLTGIYAKYNSETKEFEIFLFFNYDYHHAVDIAFKNPFEGKQFLQELKQYFFKKHNLEA